MLEIIDVNILFPAADYARNNCCTCLLAKADRTLVQTDNGAGSDFNIPLSIAALNAQECDATDDDQ